jgi:lysophospholipase L1-like esterase
MTRSDTERNQTKPRRPSVLALTLGMAALAVAQDATAQNALKAISVRSGATIIAEGDSLTYGHDLSPSGTTPPINGAPQMRSASPYPETLQRDLGNRVIVLNHGYPGDRTVDGLIRWQSDPPTDAVIIMYGTNDTGDFRPNHEGRLTPDTYRRVLLDLIRRAEDGGAKVIVVAPPPAQDPQTDASMTPYRVAAKSAAVKADAAFVDPRAAIDSVPSAWTDGLHLSPAGYSALAQAVSQAIEVR